MPTNNSFANNKPFKPQHPAKSSSTSRVVEDGSPSPDSSATVAQEAASQAHPAIPPALLSRLLHDNFKNSDTRITKEAMTVVQRYIEIFTREAVVRSVLAKRQGNQQGQPKDDNFFEVEDLEKIVPQLLLDF